MRLLTNATLQYVDEAAHAPARGRDAGPAMRSDFIRLTLLETYGGVYMDASVILTTPLDRVADAGLDRFQAFFNPDNMTEGCDVPVIENSFLAAARPSFCHLAGFRT